jgi:predicted dehydrogenase
MAHLRAFFVQVRGGQETDPLQPGLDDARRLLEVVEAAHESARTGRVVRLAA